MENRTIKNEYFPDVVSHPGETMSDFLEELEMSQADLAERMGRPKKTINEILKGKASITPETAIQLEKVLGMEAKFWLTRQANFDEWLAYKEEKENIVSYTDWSKKFPIHSMVKFGWIPEKTDIVSTTYELLKFFGVASPNEWVKKWDSAELAFRESPAYTKSLEATSAWLRKGELEAQEIECQQYNAKHFENALAEIRTLTKDEPQIFMRKLVDLCSASGVAIAFVPPLKGVTVFGVTKWINPHKALIQLSLRGKFEDIFWFTFFHEACHILKHGKRQVFLEENQSQSHEETEANEFSRDWLIPRDDWDEYITDNKSYSKKSVIDFADKINVSPAIVVGRLHHEKRIPRSFLNDLRRRYDFS